MILAQSDLAIPSLQYGAFALCVILVGLCLVLIKVLMTQIDAARTERNALGEAIGKKDEEILKLTKLCISAYNRLTEALLSKPCLTGDRALQKPFDKEEE